MSSPQVKTRAEIPTAEVAHVVDLASYQEGSVVSRTIIKLVFHASHVRRWRLDHRRFSQPCKLAAAQGHSHRDEKWDAGR